MHAYKRKVCIEANQSSIIPKNVVGKLKQAMAIMNFLALQKFIQWQQPLKISW